MLMRSVSAYHKKNEKGSFLEAKQNSGVVTQQFKGLRV